MPFCQIRTECATGIHAMADTKYEWDPNKAAANDKKHGVSFDEAVLALTDPAALVQADYSDPNEERWRTTGMGASRVLFVVTTEPDDATIRIISARKANRHEQNDYYRQALP